VGKFGKWIGAGLGWTLGGPIGALLGFAFGSLVDSTVITGRTELPPSTTRNDFIVSLLVLIAAIMKADSKILKSELDYVKRYLLQSFGKEQSIEMLQILRNMLKQDIPLNDVTSQIKLRMDYPGRLQLLHFLFGLAIADGAINKAEIQIIENIALQLGISNLDLNSVKNMFMPSTTWAYQVLEVASDSSVDEIKKAYRKMATKHHPDKVAYLGEEIKNEAKKKFQRINEAYNTIKKERGFV